MYKLVLSHNTPNVDVLFGVPTVVFAIELFTTLLLHEVSLSVPFTVIATDVFLQLIVPAGTFTVIALVAVLPPSTVVTVIVALPAATPVTSPDELTVATPVLFELHVTL